MLTYIVHNNVPLDGLNRKTMSSFWEENFFSSLRDFVNQNSSEIILENELQALGHAVVSSSDKGVLLLKENGYTVIPNESKFYAI